MEITDAEARQALALAMLDEQLDALEAGDPAGAEERLQALQELAGREGLGAALGERLGREQLSYLAEGPDCPFAEWLAWEDRGPAPGGGGKRKWYDPQTRESRYQISEPGSRAKKAAEAPAGAPAAKAAPAPAPAPAPAAKAPEAAPRDRLPPQARAQADRIAAAAKAELSDPAHPMNRLRGQLAAADFGAGAVRTLRGTKDNPLSAADHELMDRAHSRAAALLSLQGNKGQAAAQLSAAQYHRGLAERKAQAEKGSGWLPDQQVRRFDESAAAELGEHAEDWLGEIRPRERQALRTYTGDSYEDINNMLRGKDVENGGELAQVVKHMDEVFSKHGNLPKPVYTYRAMALAPDAARAMMAGFERAAAGGGTVSFPAYASTTTDPGILSKFETPGSPQESLRFEIKAKRGLYLNNISDFDDEHEILLPRDTRYRVAGIKEVQMDTGSGPKKYKVVQMEQL